MKKRVTVCPECKSINCLQTVEEAIEHYHYDAQTQDYTRVKVVDASVLSIYCCECGTFFDMDTNIENYVLEVEEGEIEVGEALSSLSEEEIEEIVKQLELEEV